MAQDWYSPWTDTGASQQTIFATQLPEQLVTLVTLHSGGTAPTNTWAFMLWADSANTLLKQRNSADNAWIEHGSLAVPLSLIEDVRKDWGTISGAVTKRILWNGQARKVTEVAIISSGTTTSSSGNELVFDLYNVTQAQSLFSALPGTYTAQTGIGGGSDIAAATPWKLTPDQNADLSADDELELRLTVTGSPTINLTLAETRLCHHAI